MTTQSIIGLKCHFGVLLDGGIGGIMDLEPVETHHDPSLGSTRIDLLSFFVCPAGCMMSLDDAI